MGFTLYVICIEDGEYVHYGKELEVNLNHVDTVAMLKFILDKLEWCNHVRVRRFDLHEDDEAYMKKDVSEQYRESAKEELGTYKEK